MNTSAAIADVQARGTRPEASGEDFRSETRLFPLAPSLVPLAWPVGTISRRTVMNNADYGVFAHRNPGKYKLRNDGGSQYRSADRRFRGLLFQEPPRITLYLPIGGPVGFCDGLFL